ncbi:hypothetical protein ACNKHO_10715 [Shigella flexneri]
MVDLVFLPIWIVLVPVRLLMTAGQRHEELADGVIATQNAAGYFQVMAEPVSDCVHDILLFSPSHSARLVTKLRIPPRCYHRGTRFARWKASLLHLYE